MTGENGKIHALAIRWSDAFPPEETGYSVLQFGVFDAETGALIGLTTKLGEEPIMMIPIVPIPPGAIRFDDEDPSGG